MMCMINRQRERTAHHGMATQGAIKTRHPTHFQDQTNSFAFLPPNDPTMASSNSTSQLALKAIPAYYSAARGESRCVARRKKRGAKSRTNRRWVLSPAPDAHRFAPEKPVITTSQ
ncbi:hypothetical protein ACLBOM_32590 [Escherichia coli]